MQKLITAKKRYSKGILTLKVLSAGSVLSKFPNDPIVRGRFAFIKKKIKQVFRGAKTTYINSSASKLNFQETSNQQEF